MTVEDKITDDSTEATSSLAEHLEGAFESMEPAKEAVSDDEGTDEEVAAEEASAEAQEEVATEGSDDGDVEPDEDDAEGDEEKPEPEPELKLDDVVSERDELKAKYEELEKSVESYKSKSQDFDSLVKYLNDSQIDNDDFTTLLKVGAALKSNPKAAIEMMMPYMEQARVAAGMDIPSNYREMVKNGEITEDAARRLTQKSQEEARRAQIERDNQQRQAEYNDLVRAISDAEVSVKRNDPDYSLIETRVVKDMELWVRQQSPQIPSPQDAVKKLEEVIADNKAILSRMQPERPKEIKPLVSKGAVSRAPQLPPANSLEEELERQLAAM